MIEDIMIIIDMIVVEEIDLIWIKIIPPRTLTATAIEEIKIIVINNVPTLNGQQNVHRTADDVKDTFHTFSYMF